MTLTGCIVHGVGVYLYLGDEGMAGGASWTIEIVIRTGLCFAQFWHPPNIPSSSIVPGAWIAKAMRSIDKAWAIARSRGINFPSECLGTTQFDRNSWELKGGNNTSIWVDLKKIHLS